MSLDTYFAKAKGTGVLATAGADGKVNAAIYARPHVMDEETVAFIMADRLTHSNIQSNKHACYLFIESSGSYVGKRLHLTRIREEKNSPLIDKLRRHCPSVKSKSGGDLYLVYYHVEKVLPLIGSESAS